MAPMIYEKDERVVVETSEGTHTAKVELDEGGLFVHVILDQGRYSDGRHRLMVSRTDVKLVPPIIRAVDIPADKLVSIPEDDQISTGQPKKMPRLDQIAALREISLIGLHGYAEDEYVDQLTLPSAVAYLDALHKAGYELVKK